MPAYVRVILLGAHGQCVLMERLDDSSWDLPYFVYPSRFEVEQVSQDVLQALAPQSTNTFFTVNCDLFGAFGCLGRAKTSSDEDLGIAALLLVESHGHEVQAPSRYSWKTAVEVADLRDDDDLYQSTAVDIVCKLLSGDASSVLSVVVDPRYQLGWFNRAASWLSSFVAGRGAAVRGRVTQVQVSPAATILMVDSTAGVFYLKAAGLGNREVQLTQTVSSLFPSYTLEVVATHVDLNCFVSPAFSPLPDDTEYTRYAGLLGQLQIESRQHLDALLEAGLPDRCPAQLAAELLKWVDDDLLRGWFGHPLRYARLAKYVPHLVTLCHQLTGSAVPMTLVHGDVSRRNMAVADEDRPILFDWEFACIGHPFYDWHELHTELSDKARRVYLDLYLDSHGKYGTVDELQSLYSAGRTLGWCIKMWHSLEQARACDVEFASSHMENFLSYWERALDGLMEVGPPGVPRDVGPRWTFG